jgi:CRISPR/Cas system CSM-associated protein Csm4 (group 5 of RAMP superfamily)
VEKRKKPWLMFFVNVKLCECEALASHRHMYLGSFFLEPEDIKNISMEAIWNFSKVTGLP